MRAFDPGVGELRKSLFNNSAVASILIAHGVLSLRRRRNAGVADGHKKCLFSDHRDVMTISRIPSVSFIASMLLTMKIIASRCYIRDPDGYIIELGQSTDLTNG